eukprot:31323-Pelagococcus_subviridis.AAC.25
MNHAFRDGLRKLVVLQVRDDVVHPVLKPTRAAVRAQRRDHRGDDPRAHDDADEHREDRDQQ